MMHRFPKLPVMSVDALVMVKALAITLVVANHSGMALPFSFWEGRGLQGGLNVLLVISGIFMATFAFNRTTPQTLQAFRIFTLRILVPSFLIALLWGIAVSNISVPELTFIRNWLEIDRVVPFPIWYVQVIAQLILVFSLLFWALDLTPKIKQSPVGGTSIALMLCLLASLISHHFWDTSHLRDRLPHLLAWYFVFGWFFWALAVRNQKTFKNRLILSCALVACEILIFTLTDVRSEETRFVWLTLFGFIFIWFDTVVLPSVLARIVLLISQATFFIFLFHYFAFYGTAFAGDLFGLGDFVRYPAVSFICGLVIPVLTWAFVTAIMRTYKKMRIGEYVQTNWTPSPFRRLMAGQRYR